MSGEEERLPKGMTAPVSTNNVVVTVSIKDTDYAKFLLRAIANIPEIDLKVIDLQVNEGIDKLPTIALVLQVSPKEG
jgi:hypothetical protein